MATILVTGAAGFIGSHLVEALLARGDRVVGFDNFDPFYSPARKRRHLAAALSHAQFVLLEADLRDAAAVLSAATLRPFGDAIDTIVHLGARANVRVSVGDPFPYAAVNVGGTLHVLEGMQQAGVRHLVLASSSSVYGNTSPVPYREDEAADRPVSPYGASKRSAELLAATYHHLYGISATCLRFFSVYGPRGRPDLTPTSFVDSVVAGRPIRQFGDGSSGRDYTYIDDILAGVLLAVDRPFGYEVINLGHNAPVLLRDYLTLLSRLLAERGYRVQIEQVPPQPGDVDLTCADITKAQRLLGYAPQTPFPTGLARFLDWYFAEREAAAAAGASSPSQMERGDAGSRTEDGSHRTGATVARQKGGPTPGIRPPAPSPVGAP